MSKQSNKYDPPSFKVVQHQPWRRPLVVSITALVGVACLLLGFALGQNKIVSQRVSTTLLSRDLGTAEANLRQLESELIDARLYVEVQKKASDTLRLNMQEKHAETLRLQEEVTFYKSLMAPGALAEGLKIAELEMVPATDEGEFQYELLMTQIALRRRFIAGEVRIDVFGKTADGAAVLSLTDLGVETAYPLKFRYRYFQDFSGQITLPDQFVADKVVVTATQNGKDPVRATFAWPQKS